MKKVLLLFSIIFLLSCSVEYNDKEMSIEEELDISSRDFQLYDSSYKDIANIDALVLGGGNKYLYCFVGNKYYKGERPRILYTNVNRDFKAWGFSGSNLEKVKDGIDAATSDIGSRTFFFFKGNEYWKVKNDRIVGGKPKPISYWGFKGDYAKQVDGGFDAVLTVRAKHFTHYFFKGNNYWKVENDRVVSGPHDISEWGFKRVELRDHPGLYVNLRKEVEGGFDAAVCNTSTGPYGWSHDHRYLFVKGNVVYLVMNDKVMYSYSLYENGKSRKIYYK